MVHHDYFAFAGYFVAQASFDAVNLTTYTNNWVANIGNAATQEAICASYVRGIVDPTVGGNETVDRYRLTLLPAYAAKMKSYNKSVIMYEGGWDRDIKPVSAAGLVSATIPYASGAFNGTNIIGGVNSAYAAALAPGYFVVGYGIPPLTRVVAVSGSSIQLSQNTTVNLPIAQFVAFTPQQMFLLAAKRSQAWATAMLTYFSQFGSGSAMPAEYIASDLRWGHTFRRLTDLATPNGVMSTFSGSRYGARNRKFVQLAFEKEWRTVRRLG